MEIMNGMTSDVAEPAGYSGAALVVGAGIAGLRTAFNLAEMGHRVWLADQAPAPGGLLLQLEHQFPTNHCGLCRIRPGIDRDPMEEGCLRRGMIHERVTFLPRTTVTSVTGIPGRLAVKLREIPAGIDPGRCTACGRCAAVCPVVVADPFQAGLGQRRAVHPAAPFSPAGPWVIDWQACTRCGACVTACPTGAVNPRAEERTPTLEPLALVLLATGRTLTDPSGIDLYGAGRIPNVITAMAYERLISPAGPGLGLSAEGLPRRPSDGAEVRKVAWIQCVGSRNVMHGAAHCAQVCCSFALKEAVLTRERSAGQVDTAIFYMDFRTPHRDMQRERDRAQRDLGVRLIRCRVHGLDLAGDPGMVRVRYLDPTDGPAVEDFDLVVLSTGEVPGRPEALAWADHPGVMTLDSATLLGDIAETLIGADAITARAVEILGPPPRNESPAPTGNVGAAKSQALVAYCSPRAANLDWDGLQALFPTVAFTCLEGPVEDNTSAALAQALRSAGADRLLLLAPGPTLGRLPASALARELGLAPAMIEVVDYNFLLDQDAARAETTTALGKYLETMIPRLLARESVTRIGVEPRRRVLVVGAGPAGLAATADLVRAGLEVLLIEKDERIAGTADRLLEESDRRMVADLAAEVQAHPQAEILPETEAIGVQGPSGDFAVLLRDRSGGTFRVGVGAVILATGGGSAPSGPYGPALGSRVVTVAEFSRILDSPEPPADLDEVAFILCVGSREEPRNYCGRVCCPAALTTARRVKESRPTARVSVWYRDVMTYGHSEEIYAQARRAGVLFIPFDRDRPPRVTNRAGRPMIEGFDPILGEETRRQPDWICLATGVVPNPNRDLARAFGLTTTRDGFLAESDVKWRPTDGREGVYLCGLARNPVRLIEAIKEGRAAAGRAARLLLGGARVAPKRTAYVKDGACVRCLLCLEPCPYGARYLDDQGGPVHVDPAACQGCGACVAACPAGAARLDDCEEEGLEAALRAWSSGKTLTKGSKP